MNNNTSTSDESIDMNSRIFVNKIFKLIFIFIILFSSVFIIYWLFSSNRYVSESIILIQNTQQINKSNMDITSILGEAGSSNKNDQLLLSEYLLSMDMLKKLDKVLNLKEHYSDTRWDFASRMILGKYYFEWFYRYYRSRVSVIFDDFSGVLRIQAQAYDPQTSHSIVQYLVKDGEWFMNEMSHALARVQVDFLEKQVSQAQSQVLKASKDLINFQNQKGLISPTATVESIHAIIAKLEGQRTELQTKLASLPKSLDNNHPTKKTLYQSLNAIEKQIANEQIRLASTSGKPLNSLMEQEQLLQLELKFKQDLYQTSLIALEKGKMDAARAIKHVSILQKPSFPEYALQPRRIYGIIATLCITFLLIGITSLLKSIILDHVD